MADAATTTVTGQYKINYDTAGAASETWLNANNKFESGPKTIADGNAFNSLTTPIDVAASYVAELKKSIEEVFLFTKKQQAAFQQLIDDGLTDPGGQDPGGDDPTDPGGGGGPSGENPEDPTTPPVVVPPAEIPVSELIPVDSLEDVSVSQIDGIVDSLIELAGDKPLDEFISDPTSSDKIRDALLQSPYIPDDLKKLLQEADSELVRQTIQALMKGKMPEVFALNPLNIGIVYSYLSKIASDNGITVEQLLNDPQYSGLLKAHLAGFEDVIELIKGWEDLSAEELQANLLSIYDGDGIGDMKDSTVNIMRTFVDYIADATEIPAEELLLDTKYADILKNATEQFGKTSVFMNAASHYSSDGMQGVINSLVDGSNAAALGMDESEVNGFKSEIDALAKEKGVTSEVLLSDSKYADDVKNTLAASENAKEVGLIYEKSESSVSQNVAKNLYNTKFETESTTNLTQTTTDGTTTTTGSATGEEGA